MLGVDLGCGSGHVLAVLAVLAVQAVQRLQTTPSQCIALDLGETAEWPKKRFPTTIPTILHQTKSTVSPRAAPQLLSIVEGLTFFSCCFSPAKLHSHGLFLPRPSDSHFSAVLGLLHPSREPSRPAAPPPLHPATHDVHSCHTTDLSIPVSLYNYPSPAVAGSSLSDISYPISYWRPTCWFS